MNYKVHLDGYNQLPFLREVSGRAANNNGAKSARDKFFYSDDEGLLVCMRQGDYKYVFSEQRMPGTMGSGPSLSPRSGFRNIQPYAGSL